MNEQIPGIVETTPEPELQKKPMLGALARSIFVDSILEFFRGIGSYLALHARLLFESFQFVWVPFYHGTKEEADRLMNRSQAVFGFLLTVLGALIFLVKVNAIEEPDANLSNLYGNEQTGILINIAFFIILAISYFVLQALMVLLGRFYRLITRPTPNMASNDMLYIHMGNQVFILGALGGLIMRMIHNNDTIDSDSNSGYYIMIAFVVFAILYIIIFSRLFWHQKNISLGIKIIYTMIVAIVHGLIASFIASMLIFFYVGI